MDHREHETSIPLPVKCCDKFISEIKADNLLSVMEVKPFTRIPTDPVVYMQSDGGHGGMEEISFCPFCGTRIEFPKRS